MQESGLPLARSGASMRASGPSLQPFHRFAGSSRRVTDSTLVFRLLTTP
jgi:hypothetical protein